MLENLKRCNGCSQQLPRTHFYRSATNKDGLDYSCKDCRSIISKKARTKRGVEINRQRDNVYQLRHNYRITLAEYQEQFTAQDGVCYICCKPEPLKNTRLAVDHDHATGKNRMLLCSQCNQGLGRFMDDPELLEKAANYLQKFK